VEQDERTLRLLLLALENLLERSLGGGGVFLPPGYIPKWGEQQSPSIVVGGIVPAVGGSATEFPVVPSGQAGEHEENPHEENPPVSGIVEGFEVSVSQDKVVVGRGKYRWDGEEREFGGAEVSLPSNPPHPVFIVFNLQRGEVGLTYYPSAVEVVLYVRQ